MERSGERVEGWRTEGLGFRVRTPNTIYISLCTTTCPRAMTTPSTPSLTIQPKPSSISILTSKRNTGPTRKKTPQMASLPYELLPTHDLSRTTFLGRNSLTIFYCSSPAAAQIIAQGRPRRRLQPPPPRRPPHGRRPRHDPRPQLPGHGQGPAAVRRCQSPLVPQRGWERGVSAPGGGGWLEGLFDMDL